MAEQVERDQWAVDSEAVFAEVRARRVDHPTATWVEIQDAVDGGIQRLRERMLTDTAQASALTDFAYADERPRCRVCGDLLQARMGSKFVLLPLRWCNRSSFLRRPLAWITGSEEWSGRDLASLSSS